MVKGPQQLTVHALLQLWQAAFPAWRSTALDRRPEWAPLPSATEASGDSSIEVQGSSFEVLWSRPWEVCAWLTLHTMAGGPSVVPHDVCLKLDCGTVHVHFSTRQGAYLLQTAIGCCWCWQSGCCQTAHRVACGNSKQMSIGEPASLYASMQHLTSHSMQMSPQMIADNVVSQQNLGCGTMYASSRHSEGARLFLPARQTANTAVTFGGWKQMSTANTLTACRHVHQACSG